MKGHADPGPALLFRFVCSCPSQCPWHADRGDVAGLHAAACVQRKLPALPGEPSGPVGPRPQPRGPRPARGTAEAARTHNLGERKGRGGPCLGRTQRAGWAISWENAKGGVGHALGELKGRGLAMPARTHNAPVHIVCHAFMLLANAGVRPGQAHLSGAGDAAPVLQLDPGHPEREPDAQRINAREKKNDGEGMRVGRTKKGSHARAREGLEAWGVRTRAPASKALMYRKTLAERLARLIVYSL